MYYPYFRGKQYELIALRELSSSLTNNYIIPIIEPVKENDSGLKKCIDSLTENNVPFIIIANPKHGDFKNNNHLLLKFINDDLHLKSYKKAQIGYLINNDSGLNHIIEELKNFSDRKIALIHYGYNDGKALSQRLKAENISIETNIFIDKYSGKLYQRHFEDLSKNTVLIRDGFKKQKNAHYANTSDEEFSELHLTYKFEGVSAFGDFLMISDDYSESGGPAYAVAIHLTYFKQDGIMHVKHFVSERIDSPVDPAGKFLEALKKLCAEIKNKNSLVLKTKAVLEFEKLNADKHFPGLGYIKKLSIKHHLELMLDYFKDKK